MTSTQPPRARRSALYLPASNARAVEKARSLAADAVILDLEDAVLPESKLAARAAAVAAVDAGGFGRREVVIRVNGLDTAWGADDLAAVARSAATAVLIPKVASAAGLAQAVARLDAAGGGRIDVWAMAELPAAVLALDAIAAANPRLRVVAMGTADLCKAMRVPADPDRSALLPALALCLLAARARGLDILDGVHTDLRDTTGYRSACEQGKALGFDGKTLIHPSQIPVANEVFGVSAEAAAEAARLIAVWEAAAADGRGIALLDGRMVEGLHAEEARRVLALRAAQANQQN
ncbi:MAG: CoA ester lyase [Gammaproteobacteria bacterium]|nr:CoA ester lyase [Gammaproteobacteria bacterium]